jgi:hypothetical protein
MTNICRPGSAKDIALQKHPRAICIKLCKKRYVVYDKPRAGSQIGNGITGEAAWHNVNGTIKDRIYDYQSG